MVKNDDNGETPSVGGKGAEPHERSPLLPVWRKFASTLPALMVVDPDDRTLDQYLALRDHAVSIAQSPVFENELERAWFSAGEKMNSEVGAALLAELGAVPRAVEVAQATATSTEQKTSWLKRTLARAGVAVDSAKDILEEGLPSYAKAGLIVLKQAIDVFAG